jgi:hypothetical protein
VKRHILPLLAVLFPLLTAAGENAFFRTTVVMVSGRPLTPKSILVEEVDRTATSSIVEVSAGGDATDLLSSAALVGLCGVARHRGERYFQARHISHSPLTLEVTFPKVGSESAAQPTSAMAPNVFPVASCRSP